MSEYGLIYPYRTLSYWLAGLWLFLPWLLDNYLPGFRGWADNPNTGWILYPLWMFSCYPIFWLSDVHRVPAEG